VTSGYTIIEHPADLGIEARGTSLEDAFQHAATGLVSILMDAETIEPTERRLILVEGTDLEQLLVHWLTEVLYLYDGQHFAPREFRITKISHSALEAEVIGEPFSPTRHNTRLDVKAITYHQLLVQPEHDGVLVRVFVDI
jgi:SHS2 domain-containing protein